MGKVFADADEDGFQDEGEPGLPGVRIATTNGEWIVTDEFGRFSLPGVDPGKNNWGRNAILKVDSASLPDGSEFTTENPRVLRITGGLMNQFDFGVKLPTSRPVEPKAREVTTVTVTEVEASVDPVYFDSGEFYIAESYATQLSAAIEALGAVSNLRVVVEGHTDSQPLSERAKARYATNYGLAYERAGAVASYLSERLGKPPEQFVTQGYGPIVR